jgi:alkylhydroperoxidase family enzyme
MTELPLDQWDAEIRASIDPRSASPLQMKSTGIMARAPHMALANFAFLERSMRGRTLSRRLLELVRLRIGFHNQCRSCMAMRFQSAIDDGFTEDLVCSLEKPMEAANLTDAEKAALEYTDIFVTNHFAINEATMDKLRQHFSENEIVELSMFAGYFLGIGRFMASLDIVEELPKEFQDKSIKAAPWETKTSVLIQDT